MKTILEGEKRRNWVIGSLYLIAFRVWKICIAYTVMLWGIIGIIIERVKKKYHVSFRERAFVDKAVMKTWVPSHMNFSLANTTKKGAS